MKIAKKVDGKLVIEQKRVGTGTIHDLESQHYDIQIPMATHKWVVILPAYFEMSPIRCESYGDALDSCEKLLDEGYYHSSITVMDTHGEEKDVEDWMADLAACQAA